MKKLVIMSDNHGFTYATKRVYELENDGDYYIHCGDSEAYRKDDLNGYICVNGNNDWGLGLPNQSILEIEGLRVLITHGQFFGYFNKEKRMIDLLKKNKCQVLISGHTHMPSVDIIDGYTLINPGSTHLPRGGSKPSYAVAYIDNDKIKVEIKDYYEE